LIFGVLAVVILDVALDLALNIILWFVLYVVVDVVSHFMVDAIVVHIYAIVLVTIHVEVKLLLLRVEFGWVDCCSVGVQTHFRVNSNSVKLS